MSEGPKHPLAEAAATAMAAATAVAEAKAIADAKKAVDDAKKTAEATKEAAAVKAATEAAAVAKRHYKLLTVPTEALEANAWNVQTQDDATFTRLREEIRKVGFLEPIQVLPKEEPDKYVILGGEHRWKAALAEGLTEVPVIVLTDAKWKDADLAKMVSVRVNILKGKIDNEKFAKLYSEMADKYGADALQEAFGFTNAKAFQKMLGEISKGLSGLSKEVKKKFDESAKEAKTVEELTSILQELFAKYGDSTEQNFMIFTHGKRQHLYISMGHKLKASMEKLTEYCKVTKTDINEVFQPLAEDLVKRLEALNLDAFK
jgi:hypothetical protein